MDCDSVALDFEVKTLFGQKTFQDPSISPMDLCPKSFLLSSPEPLLNLFPFNRSSPGSPQMDFIPFLENNVKPSRNLNLLQYGFPGEYQVGTRSLSSPHCNGKNAPPNQPWVENLKELEEGLKIHTLWHLSQHILLLNRADNLQQRALMVLGEHGFRHYSHQLKGLKKKHKASCSPNFPMISDPLFQTFNLVQKQQAEQAFRTNLQNRQAQGQTLESRDLQNLAHSSHAVLNGMLESLDSDATVSSSDEEWDPEDAKESQCHVCELEWLMDRAELCSRWTWLQERVSDLESQIQGLGELQQQIRSNKGHVVLADCQPLTDMHIQSSLWTETMDLSFTAGNKQDLYSDLDMDLFSPTRLLRNIERQSAQLINLMPSFFFSPSSSPKSKEPCDSWRGQQKATCSSHLSAFDSSGSPNMHKVRKRKRPSYRRLCQVDATYTSARTRPLLTYSKRRLFTMDPLSHREQGLQSSPSFLPGCAFCNPVSECTSPACPHREERAGKVHPVLTLSSEIPLTFHLKNALLEENLLQRSLMKTEHCSPYRSLSSRGRVSRSLFHCCHRMRNGRKRQRSHRSSVQWTRTQDHRRPAYREAERMRLCPESPRDMENSSVTPKSDLVSKVDDGHMEGSSEDGTISYCTPTQQKNSQVPLSRTSCERSFSTDDVVVPMSLFNSKEKKNEGIKHNILTPSWRRMHFSPLFKREEQEQEEVVLESLEDEDFFQRHQSYERREKLLYYWDQNRRDRIRSSRQSFSSAGSSIITPWGTFSPPETPAKASVDDREAVLPWTRRIFPLTGEDED